MKAYWGLLRRGRGPAGGGEEVGRVGEMEKGGEEE